MAATPKPVRKSIKKLNKYTEEGLKPMREKYKGTVVSKSIPSKKKSMASDKKLMKDLHGEMHAEKMARKGKK